MENRCFSQTSPELSILHDKLNMQRTELEIHLVLFFYSFSFSIYGLYYL